MGLTPQLPVALDYEDWVRLYYGQLAEEEDEQLQAAVEYLQDLRG